MDGSTRNGFRRLVERSEAGIAQSILRWKYHKEGRLPFVQNGISGRCREDAGK